MSSMDGLVPITRSFLAAYYDKYSFPPLSEDVAALSSRIRSLSNDLLGDVPPTEGEKLLIEEADRTPPHKIDENMWKNREQMEEIVFLLEKSNWPAALQQELTTENTEFATIFSQLKDKVQESLSLLISFQARNSERVFNTVMTYLPQDFRGTLIRQQRDRSERNKQAEVDALINSGGSIRDRYALLWKQQMDRRRQLAQLGSATGVYKTLVKYLVGVPQVLLDFIKQINDDDGPMEEQRQRYGPPLYNLTSLVLFIRLFLSLSWGRFETRKLKGDELSALEQALNVYTSEFERFIKFLSEVFVNSPFFISAAEAGALEAGQNDDYKEISIPAGKIHEVSFMVDSLNSYIAWDFSLVQGKINLLLDAAEGRIEGYVGLRVEVLARIVHELLTEKKDIGFSVECMSPSGEKTLILPYRRYESDQGNFCTCIAGNYKLVWDNSYSTFFKKALRYKVDCIPPVVEPVQSMSEEEA